MSMREAIAEAMAAYEAQELAEAQKAGLTLEAYRAQVDAVERQREREEWRRAVQETRKRRLAPMLALMPKAASDAIIAGELANTRALRVTQRWVRNPEAPPILVLFGGYGAGKTVAAAWALAANPGGEYVQATDLAARHEPYTNDRERGVKLLHVTRPALLIIDDLGTEKRGGGEPDKRFAPALYDVFNRRLGVLENGQPRRTLITTNVDREGFTARYAPDDRIKSRLARDAFFAPCGNDDMRRAK